MVLLRQPRRYAAVGYVPPWSWRARPVTTQRTKERARETAEKIDKAPGYVCILCEDRIDDLAALIQAALEAERREACELAAEQIRAHWTGGRGFVIQAIRRAFSEDAGKEKG